MPPTPEPTAGATATASFETPRSLAVVPPSAPLSALPHLAEPPEVSAAVLSGLGLKAGLSPLTTEALVSIFEAIGPTVAGLFFDLLTRYRQGETLPALLRAELPDLEGVRAQVEREHRERMDSAPDETL